MKIKEIIENVDHNSMKILNVIYSIFVNTQQSFEYVENKLHMLLIMSNKKINNEQWTQILSKLDIQIDAFERSIALYTKYQLKKNTFDESDYSETINDIWKMREHIRNTRSRFPKSLSEQVKIG